MYEELSFSPTGSYLAFLRNESGVDRRGIIYDIKNKSIASQITGENNPYQFGWYKNTDSFISVDAKAIDGSENDSREVYLQTISGEKSLLAKFVTYAGWYNINYNIDTAVYLDPPGSQNVNIYNWAKNTTMQLNFNDYGGAPGDWTPDGKSFLRLSDTDRNYFVIDLETGKYKEIKYQNVGDLSSFSFMEISPNSQSILLGDYLHLYDFNLETQQMKILYTTLYPSDDFLSNIYGVWSPNNKLLIVYENDPAHENDPATSIRLNYTNLFATDGSQSSPIAQNIEPYLWLSNSVERFLYVQNNISGNQMSRELMLYDHANQSSVKLDDLPAVNDLGTAQYSPTASIADWVGVNVDFLADSISTPVTGAASDIKVPLGSRDLFSSPYFLAVSLGCLFTMVFLVGVVIVFVRIRRTKRVSPGSANLSRHSSGEIKNSIQLARSGRLQEAFDKLRDIVQSEPENANAWFYLGLVCFEMKNYKDAERCYLRAKKFGHPKADEALKNLIQSLEESKRLSR
jgi:hypothetical protein